MLLNKMRESKVNGNLNPYLTKLSDLNLQPLEVVSRVHDPQPRLIENICLIWAQILANLDVYTHLSFQENNDLFVRLIKKIKPTIVVISRRRANAEESEDDL